MTGPQVVATAKADGSEYADTSLDPRVTTLTVPGGAVAGQYVVAVLWYDTDYLTDFPLPTGGITTGWTSVGGSDPEAGFNAIAYTHIIGGGLGAGDTTDWSPAQFGWIYLVDLGTQASRLSGWTIDHDLNDGSYQFWQGTSDFVTDLGHNPPFYADPDFGGFGWNNGLASPSSARGGDTTCVIGGLGAKAKGAFGDPSDANIEWQYTQQGGLPTHPGWSSAGVNFVDYGRNGGSQLDPLLESAYGFYTNDQDATDPTTWPEFSNRLSVLDAEEADFTPITSFKTSAIGAAWVLYPTFSSPTFTGGSQHVDVHPRKVKPWVPPYRLGRTIYDGRPR